MSLLKKACISQQKLPADIYLFKETMEILKQMRQTWSKLLIKTPERRHWLFGGFSSELDEKQTKWYLDSYVFFVA